MKLKQKLTFASSFSSFYALQRTDLQQGQSAEFTERFELEWQCIVAKDNKECHYT